MKFVKFCINYGVGDHKKWEILEFPDNAKDTEIQEYFNFWYDSRRKDYGEWDIASIDEVNEYYGYEKLK